MFAVNSIVHPDVSLMTFGTLFGTQFYEFQLSAAVFTVPRSPCYAFHPPFSAGPRYICKICDRCDMCESCFKTSRSHRHSFSRVLEPGGAAVSAGRPGRWRRTAGAGGQPGSPSVDGLVSEFRRCVRGLSVSSLEGCADRLAEDVSGFWQSCGTRGKVSRGAAVMTDWPRMSAASGRAAAPEAR